MYNRHVSYLYNRHISHLYTDLLMKPHFLQLYTLMDSVCSGHLRYCNILKKIISLLLSYDMLNTEDSNILFSLSLKAINIFVQKM